MSAIPHSSRRQTAAVVVRSLLWLWLVCLSVLVFLGYRGMDGLADRERVDAGLQRLDARMAALAQTTQALQQQPSAATAAGLQEARQALEARIAQIEQALSGRASADDLQALRAQIERDEQARASQAARAAASTPPRAARTAAKPEPPPLPFRVIGAELRAGEPSVAVAPTSGDLMADQVRVLLPGDALGAWRLRAIEGRTAVFQAGGQTRRMAIP